jgi:hypothetical protein
LVEAEISVMPSTKKLTSNESIQEGDESENSDIQFQELDN